MEISARVVSRASVHEAEVQTAGRKRVLQIPPKEQGAGSGVNGGELLFLALATCYCNDVYREAARRNLRIEEVIVEVTGEFGADGDAARNVAYRVRARSPEPAAAVAQLLRHTDTVAEIQNTLRAGVAVALADVVVEPATV